MSRDCGELSGSDAAGEELRRPSEEPPGLRARHECVRGSLGVPRLGRRGTVWVGANHRVRATRRGGNEDGARAKRRRPGIVTYRWLGVKSCEVPAVATLDRRHGA